MQIFGREYKFRFTVGASAKIAELCPEKSLKHIGDCLQKSYPDMVQFVAKMAAIMSEAEERAALFEAGIPQEKHRLQPLTVEAALSLPDAEFAQLQKEVFAVWRGDAKQQVETSQNKRQKKTDAEN